MRARISPRLPSLQLVGTPRVLRAGARPHPPLVRIFRGAQTAQSSAGARTQTPPGGQPSSTAAPQGQEWFHDGSGKRMDAAELTAETSSMEPETSRMPCSGWQRRGEAPRTGYHHALPLAHPCLCARRAASLLAGIFPASVGLRHTFVCISLRLVGHI